jgi:hypothetical protein
MAGLAAAGVIAVKATGNSGFSMGYFAADVSVAAGSIGVGAVDVDFLGFSSPASFTSLGPVRCSFQNAANMQSPLLSCARPQCLHYI